jgi:arylsulfatase A-like enzyme
VTTRRAFLATALNAASARQNIIIVLADDLGYGDLGCFGSKTNRTPHLDRLAADGVRFTDHYSCSPVCSPARAGLLTGLVPDRVGITGVLRDQDDSTGLSLNVPTMADHFRRQGLRTALIGKWHLGMSGPYHPIRRGFDSFWGFLNGTIDYQTHLSTGGGGRGTRTTYQNRIPLELSGYYPDLLNDQAARFVEQNRSDPYFLLVAHALPHTPLQATDQWLKPYAANMPDVNARYAAMVACLDGCVGRMRSALERTGQWDRTVIVFISDNGWVKKVTPAVAPAGSNGPLRGGKYELYEGGIRVPCIVRWPGVTRPGTVSHVPTWFPDWLPTLTGNSTQDGRDLRSVLSGSAGHERALCWRFADPLVKTPLSYAARRGRWKLLITGDERALYDLAADAGETKNVIDAESTIAARLERDLDAWKQSLP